MDIPARESTILTRAERGVALRRRRFDFYFTLLTALTDTLVIPLAFYLAHWFRFRSGWLRFEQLQPWEEFYPLVTIQTLAVVACCALQGLYRQRRVAPWSDVLYRCFISVSVASTIATALSVVVSSDYNYSRSMLAFAWIIGVLLLTLSHQFFHILYGQLRALGVNEETVLIAGTNEIGRRVLRAIRASRALGYRPIGFLSENGATDFEGLPVLGGTASIGLAVRQYGVDKVIIGIPGMSPSELEELVVRCSGADTAIRIYPEPFQIMATEPRIEDLGGLPLVAVRESRLKGHNIVLKRMLDVVGSGLGLIALSPLMLLIALLVKLTSPGPVFYIQERVGLDGKVFKIIKFRTMRADAEAGTGAVWATPDDDRRTRLGAFLRRTSLDELPQLINVLIGEMSLVGPRPERPEFVEEFRARVPRYHERHHEKAGITGWAQVNGLRGQCSIEERTAADLWYVENWTLWLDVKILLLSLLLIVHDDHAY